jgi:hypothetical protein
MTITLLLAIGQIAQVALPDPASRGHPPRVNLAMVLLTQPALPSAEAILHAFPTFAGPNERLKVSQREGEAQTATVLEFELTPGGISFVALITVPVPSHEADEGARFSISSLTTDWTLPPHQAHLVVTLQQPDTAKASALDELSAFTSLLAAVASVAPAIGIYWGSAGATHDSAFFIESARARDIALRVALWTGLSLARESDGRFSLLSLGMKQLHLPDLLLVGPPDQADGMLLTFFDLLLYLATRGTPIPEGDTVGRTPEERLTVHYIPSPVDPAVQVWRVELK